MQEMGRIIERDFFPDLEKLRAQNAYLEAVERNDVEKLREIYAKYSSGKRPPTERCKSNLQGLILFCCMYSILMAFPCRSCTCLSKTDILEVEMQVSCFCNSIFFSSWFDVGTSELSFYSCKVWPLYDPDICFVD
jgi:hypothetical protein